MSLGRLLLSGMSWRLRNLLREINELQMGIYDTFVKEETFSKKNK